MPFLNSLAAAGAAIRATRAHICKMSCTNKYGTMVPTSNHHPPATLPRDGDGIRVSFKARKNIMQESQRNCDVSDSEVDAPIQGTWRKESEDTQTILKRDNNRSGGQRESGAIQAGPCRRSLIERAPMNPRRDIDQYTTPYHEN